MHTWISSVVLLPIGKEHVLEAYTQHPSLTSLPVVVYHYIYVLVAVMEIVSSTVSFLMLGRLSCGSLGRFYTLLAFILFTSIYNRGLLLINSRYLLKQ